VEGDEGILQDVAHIYLSPSSQDLQQEQQWMIGQEPFKTLNKYPTCAKTPNKISYILYLE
jgi:hypothetical protein